MIQEQWSTTSVACFVSRAGRPWNTAPACRSRRSTCYTPRARAWLQQQPIAPSRALYVPESRHKASAPAARARGDRGAVGARTRLRARRWALAWRR